LWFFIGCGAAVGFVAGALRRAPIRVQHNGLERAHRLAQEPGRYPVHDSPTPPASSSPPPSAASEGAFLTLRA
jgi:hypothetical protein